MATEATETMWMGNETEPNETVLREPIRPEPNRLDWALRSTAFLLILIASSFMINPLGHDDSSLQYEAFLLFAVIIFGVSLLFISVMLARSPTATAIAAFVVKLIHNSVFGDV